MRIIEFEKKYKDATINLLIDVAVEEHGFKEWEIWFKKFNNENYKKDKGNCWIAINEQDEVVGTISLKNIDNKLCELKNLYVKKEYRRNGIAKELFNISMKFAESQNFEKIQLDTYDKFHIAMKFYEKNGFTLEKKIVENNKNIYIYSKFLKQELISVIVPIYNVEKYIKNCINSLMEQTYKNLQIILVDDGSKDSSGKICDEYSKNDGRIEVIHKVNGGLADARNKGLEAAKGKYIGFLDGDDYVYPTFYEDLYNLLKYNNAEIAECDFLRIKEDKIDKMQEIISNYNNNLTISNKICNGEEALKLLYGSRLHPYVKKVVVWNKLYKREILNKIEFPVGRLHEDEFTTYKILNKCKKIVSTNKVLHGYLQTSNSIMRSKIEQKRIDDNLEAYIKASDFFEEKNDQIIEMICRRRYLENCIELSGKILKQEKDIEKLEKLAILYKRYYDIYIEKIIINNEDRNAIEIIDLLKETYNSLRKNSYIEEKFWIELEKIINKL